jgi:hypothetical protein
MSFARPSPAEHQERNCARREACFAAMKPLAVRPNYSGTTAAPLPKGETARPGKRAPTVAEREWMDRIVAWGCVACWLDGMGRVEPCVHHILRGGRRMGHLFTLPLCGAHHQHDTASGLIARHPFKARFEEKYGSESKLLEWLRLEIGAQR